MKFIIQGKRKIGKSTFIKECFSDNVEGIISKRIESGIIIGYMNEYKINDWKICAVWNGISMKPEKIVFDTFADIIVKKLFKTSKTIIIDEIGFVELCSKYYCNQLVELCKKKNDIAVVLRDEQNSLIDEIISIDGFEYIYLTRENRDNLFRMNYAK